jgi:hypothetical protein
MLTFLFWNLRAVGVRAGASEARLLRGAIAELARTYLIDVLAFAECDIPSPALLQDLNRSGEIPGYFYASGSVCTKIQLFTRFPSDLAPNLSQFETDRLMIRHLRSHRSKSILLAAMHGRSKYGLDLPEMNQADDAKILAGKIQAAEQFVGHSKTVLVGDLNMNPFEPGVVDATGLHAVMTKQLARQKLRGTRERMPRFYNPMWSLFGDRGSGPPGTYYYASSGNKFMHFWHMFDQVLIRPDLLDSFQTETLQIIDFAGSEPLVSRQGIPRKGKYSDHLPILFQLNL